MAEERNDTAVAEDEKPLGIDRTEKSGWVEPEPEGDESGEEQKGEQPDAAQKALERPSAEEIYRQVAHNAKAELKRSNTSLAMSGFTGGMFMGFSALGVGIVLGILGTSPGAYLISRLLYPLGFIVVILGRSQLFTENTLYPVALVLAEKRHLWNTLRLWAIVLPANIAGALGFAALISLTHALPTNMQQAIVKLGVEAVQAHMGAVFWSGVMGGWIIATAAWMVSGSHSISGSILLIWLLTFIVGAGNFAHCIATSGEILTSVLLHQVATLRYVQWLGAAVAGNVCGGVLMVTLLEYGQAIYGTEIEKEVERGDRTA